jgi:myosin heavy subunit
MRSKQQKVKSFNELTSRSLILAELRKVENEIGKIKSRTHQLREIKKQRSRPHAYVAPVAPVSKTVYNDPTLSRSAPLSTRPGDGWQNDGGWIEDVKNSIFIVVFTVNIQDVYASKYANQTSYHSGESELEQIRREREELARKSEQLRQQTYHDDYHVRQMQEEEAALEEERRQIEEMRQENERIQREVAEEKRRQALEEQKYEQERIAEDRRRQLDQERQAAEQKRREL